MIGKDANLRQLRSLLTKSTFLLLDVISFILFGLTFFAIPSIWKTILLTAGSTFLTLGITLPIAIYYQNKFNYESFELLKACDISGIKAIFTSRQQDDSNLRDAIEEASQTTSNEIFMLGICMRTVFDPNIPHTPYFLAKINSPQIRLRVIILDPKSPAAKRRAAIEIGSNTIDDIKTTINRGLVSTAQTRFTDLMRDNGDFEYMIRKHKDTNDHDEKAKILERIMEHVNLSVHLYSKVDPILFIMGFDDTLFAEQYHFGREEGVVPFGGCIGKYVPVIQFKRESRCYSIFKCHFEYMWQDCSQDITHTIINLAIKDFPLEQ